MRRIRFGGRVVIAVAVAGVVSIAVLSAVKIVHGRHPGGSSNTEAAGDVAKFNQCIDRTRLLARATNQHRNGVIETIADAAHGSLVGEVSVNGATLAGAAAGDGRYVMSTTTPTGRDASAIEGCWDRASPISPGV